MIGGHIHMTQKIKVNLLPLIQPNVTKYNTTNIKQLKVGI